jgi:hypothetical protein
MTSVLKYGYERSIGSIHKAEADFSRGQADAIAIPLQPAAHHLHGNQTRFSRSGGGFLSLR